MDIALDILIAVLAFASGGACGWAARPLLEPARLPPLPPTPPLRHGSPHARVSLIGSDGSRIATKSFRTDTLGDRLLWGGQWYRRDESEASVYRATGEAES